MSTLTELKSNLSALVGQQQSINEQIRMARSKLLAEVQAIHKVSPLTATDLLAVANDPLAYPVRLTRLIERGLVVSVMGGANRAIRRGSSSSNTWHELTEVGEEIAMVLQPDGWSYTRPSDEAIERAPAPRG